MDLATILEGFGPMSSIARRLLDSLSGLGRRGALLLGLLLVCPVGLLVILRTIPELDLALESPSFHVVVVSAIAACALVVGLATAMVAARVRLPAPVLLALGCVLVGLLMLGHGLTTPGVLGRPMNMWVGRFPVLAIAGFALCLAAATGAENPIARLVARAPRLSLVLSVVTLAVACLIIIVSPTVVWGTRPFPLESQVRSVLLAASGLALLATGGVHWRRWRLGRDRIELSFVLACWLAMASILSLELGRFWRISWWDYHAYLLAGFGAAVLAVAAQYRRSRSFEGALESLTLSDPMQHIARGHPEALHALVGAVEAKDPYTHGHSARVADLSTRIGLRLGLDPDSLRGLNQGALLHDVGKISVPDQVLNKPDRLTPEEWTSIQSHPVVGWELANKARSLKHAMTAIRHHHERWDGSGYPDRLTREDIPLAGRIVAVADVWDALTSDRAYREAWPLDKALTHIAGASGTLFDPLCVEAFLDLVAERGLSSERGTPDLQSLAEAAAACHPRQSRVLTPRSTRRTRVG